MQTAAIPYRVADFLKQHPPFQFLDEAELVALAARGRVKFYTPDEYICWQASPHTSFIYVIQQGSVSLWDESVDPPALRDIRGAGDCIGFEQFNGAPTSLHSAKAATEVMVYALPAADFEPLLARHPRAAAYVAASSAVTADYSAESERPLPHETFLADLVRGGEPLSCPASTPIREAARLLSDSGTHAVALMEGEQLATLLTSSDVLCWAASGARDPEQPARNIASASAMTMPPQTMVSECVLAMAEARASAAALTSDGSAGTTIHGIVTAGSLAPAFGDDPVTILQEIVRAPDLSALRALNARARSWIRDNLAAPPALDWLAVWADLVNRRILERLLHFTACRDTQMLFCFHGSAGRQELLTALAPNIAVIGAAPPSLGTALGTALAECGYLSPKPPVAASLEEWKARFSGWIRDPILNQAYLSLSLFDLRPVFGPAPIFDELKRHVRAELAEEPAFLRILANDCLSSLPPLTFFRDLVIEESGEQTATFRLKSSALRPLIDVARVFGIASGNPLGASTSQRFQQARRLLPAREAIFREAAEAMRIMLFHQVRAGLRMGTSGSALPLSMVSRHDRQVLKSCFRSTHNLLEFTAPCDWMGAS